MAGQRVLQELYRNVASAIGKEDGDAATFTKREEGVLMSSTLKMLVQGCFRNYFNSYTWN
jgi:hypothetical protein